MRCFIATLTRWVLAGALLATPAVASPYWIAWEDGWPEEQGWRRVWRYKEAQRWLEDGTLVIDSRESVDIQDYYRKDMNGTLDPEQGKEIFLLQWRAKVSVVIGHSDPGVEVFSDGAWGAFFALNADTIYTSDGKKASFAAGVFHEFAFQSADMRNYELSIDGVPRLTGVFFKSISTSRMSWGDMVAGAASLHRWDYFRFGVLVPEPSSLAIWAALALLCVKRWLRRPARC